MLDKNFDIFANIDFPLNPHKTLTIFLLFLEQKNDMIYIAKINKEWKKMNNPLTKKLIVIGSVILTVVVGVFVIALTVGKTTYPEIENKNDVFYQRLDKDGNVIYEITNEEVYNQILSNNGIQQLLMMVDTDLLEEYFGDITQDDIDNKIKELTYGTDDVDEIAEIDAENKLELEEGFARSMILAGYEGKEDDYAKLLLAREAYAYEVLLEELTDIEIATHYENSYFDDIKAINIRFTSKEDAESVLRKYHLVELALEETTVLAEYKGFIYKDETLLDNNDNIVEAYTTVEVFYYDEDGNIVDLDDEVIYTLGSNGFFTDEDDKSYSIDDSGNLVNDVPTIIVKNEHLFETKEAAETFKEANTVYYTMNKADAFDEDESIIVKDSSDNLAFTIDKDKKVYDKDLVDVTSTHDLIFNKEYKEQSKVTAFTSNNTLELTEQEILDYYVKMYNYVYGNYRDALVEGSTKEDLIALDNEHLSFNFDDVKEYSSSLATYIFKTISEVNEKTYSTKPQAVTFSSTSFFFMTYKLEEGTKVDLATPILDIIEQSIILPENVFFDLTLPTKGAYESTISWVSDDKDVIATTGKVTNPDEGEKTEVKLTYTIKALGQTRTGSKIVEVYPLSAFNPDFQAELDQLVKDIEALKELEDNYPDLEELIGNQGIYDKAKERVLDEKINGSNGQTNVNKKLSELRTEMGFEIYDRYLILDYKSIDSTYEANNDGDSALVATLSKTPNSEETIEYSADKLFSYALEKSPAVYTIYASQHKELLYSTYFEEAFGTNRNIQRNSTDRMSQMRSAITASKQQYFNMKSMYESYGLAYPYESFADYSYAQNGTMTELALLQYYVTRELQPYLINNVINQYDLVEKTYDIVEENYDNYFSLDVVQLLVFFDFDEDGSPDDYNEYKDSLTDLEREAFLSMLAGLETAIKDYEDDFSDLVAEYLKAERTDETWGVYKQSGVFLLTEDLNTPDEEDEKVTHSLTYSGEYGVKDTYTEDFTEALIELYQEYRLPQNSELDELRSSFVPTEFGLHYILATKGDDFEQFSAKFTEDQDTDGIYSDTVYNNSDKPTVEQVELYTTYKFFSMVYDLSDADIEERLNITIPKLPANVTTAIEFYLYEVINSVYVLGTVNIDMARLLASGTFTPGETTSLTNSDIMANLEEIEETYVDSIIGKYLD